MTSATTAVESIVEHIVAATPRWREVIRDEIDTSLRSDAARLRPGLHAGIELIYEGCLLHYGTSRICNPDRMSASTALLIGDLCYAAGLSEIARSGDIEAVETLAGLIADIATSAVEVADPQQRTATVERSWNAALTDLQP